MPPSILPDGMVQNLLDFIREAVPVFHEASIELLTLILENDPATSDVAKSHSRWIYINLMRQLLPLGEEERQEWIVELFSGKKYTVEFFAETMVESGIWMESEDENGFTFFSMNRQKESNFRKWLLQPRIQEIYNGEVMGCLHLIAKKSIEGSDYISKKGPKSKYKVVTPDWQMEFIETKKQLAQSQSLIESLQETVQTANDIIDNQGTVLDNTRQQLKVARTANARSEKVWMKRYKKFFKRSWS
ncbi:uncharacterized protein EAF01_001948 [Botrytis porri]|uniref:t-SNARE coiled-coil homology domain-containing protein n=1 Tax=Botrytis porri TaxID=87229 RepID=A0A4Z1KAP8_9HELO|nr:uncharacterized protein EAF01_001948 [Botrytis porri]KAF7912927.1 hypothetical protein EAF01_001948 [Botrytis porri]TGO82498.1 hypothetical protein BPOR_0817g00010 [Botrytis porri]